MRQDNDGASPGRVPSKLQTGGSLKLWILTPRISNFSPSLLGFNQVLGLQAFDWKMTP